MNCLVGNFTKYWHFKCGDKAEESKSYYVLYIHRIQNHRKNESDPVQKLRWSLVS